MKRILTIVLVLLALSGFAQQEITLNDCYFWAEKNYPLAKQTNLLQQKSELEIAALKKAKLPTLYFNAQATYQSDVIEFPAAITNVAPLNKDQYRATFDVNQILYNGGIIDANAKFKTAQTQTQQQQVAVNLYQLKSRINYSYMMILLWQDQNKLLLDKQNTLRSRIMEVQSGVKNGAILASGAQVLEAEQLKLEQSITENAFQRSTELQNLAHLTTMAIASDAILQKPDTANFVEGTRPELQFFELQQRQIEASKIILSKSNYPKVNAFGQLGYGNPGLNMLNNSFKDFYLFGLKLNWNVFDWNKSIAEKQALDIASSIISTEKETFEINNQIQTDALQLEIYKMETILKTDLQIIQLREKIIQSFESQLRNGVITSSQYITELNQLFEAKTNQKLHETQLILSKINYQTSKGLH